MTEQAGRNFVPRFEEIQSVMQRGQELLPSARSLTTWTHADDTRSGDLDFCFARAAQAPPLRSQFRRNLTPGRQVNVQQCRSGPGMRVFASP